MAGGDNIDKLPYCRVAGVGYGITFRVMTALTTETLFFEFSYPLISYSRYVTVQCVFLMAKMRFDMQVKLSRASGSGAGIVTGPAGTRCGKRRTET
jgi:hypothetical protein